MKELFNYFSLNFACVCVDLRNCVQHFTESENVLSRECGLRLLFEVSSACCAHFRPSNSTFFPLQKNGSSRRQRDTNSSKFKRARFYVQNLVYSTSPFISASCGRKFNLRNIKRDSKHFRVLETAKKKPKKKTFYFFFVFCWWFSQFYCVQIWLHVFGWK